MPLRENQFIENALKGAGWAGLVVIGFAFGSYINSDRFCEENFPHINYNLACDEKPAVSKAAYFTFESELEKYLAEEKVKGNLSEAAVFFRDLLLGPTFGINEERRFISASLLKLPLAMTYYKLFEEDPGLLSTVVMFNENVDDKKWAQTFSGKERAVIDTPYTLKDLIRLSIAHSDNLATMGLFERLKVLRPGDVPLLNTYRELGLIPPESAEQEDLSPQGYASLFRLLYNVSYLNRNDSEEVLGMLAESSFDQGLAAGIPSEVEIANKFGEREGLANGQKQLHDCGIIYYPDNPYLLCVMTRGYEYPKLLNVIAEISRRVYEEVDSRRF